LMLVAGGVIAAAIVPLYLVYYVSRVVPGYREQVRLLMSEEAAVAYCQVFVLPLRTVTGADKNASDAVACRFNEVHALKSYIWTSAMAWLPSLFGICVTVVWIRERLAGGGDLTKDISSTFVMAFLGGYVWSLYELFERGGRGDLLPRTLIEVSFRILASVPIGYAFSLLVTEDVGAFVAFTASAFPIRDARLMLRTRTMRQLEIEPGAARTIPRQALLGQCVQGISARNLARLREIEISTVVDLAVADPIDVMVNTGLPLRALIDWIDQSLLAMYVGDRMDTLARMGIRGALEASHVYEENCGHWDEDDNELWIPDEGAHNRPVIKELAGVLDVKPQYALHLLQEIDEDPHANVLSKLWGEDEEQYGRTRP